MPTLRISSSPTGNAKVLVILLEGRLTEFEDGQRLRQTFTTALASGVKNIVLDLSRVNYINSMGIGLLVTMFTQVRRSDGNLVLAGLTKKVQDLLQVTKLFTVFNVYDNASDAVAALAGVAV